MVSLLYHGAALAASHPAVLKDQATRADTHDKDVFKADHTS
jgi:hypothetical protein